MCLLFILSTSIRQLRNLKQHKVLSNFLYVGFEGQTMQITFTVTSVTSVCRSL